METFQGFELFRMTRVFEHYGWMVDGHFNPVGAFKDEATRSGHGGCQRDSCMSIPNVLEEGNKSLIRPASVTVVVAAGIIAAIIIIAERAITTMTAKLLCGTFNWKSCEWLGFHLYLVGATLTTGSSSRPSEHS
ncbi:hypothetical protein ON010_g9385 [Phytophthora cinnamomi]|nr:hypothetical protein ON010_g9385 [Phytophthora cinnamomi]